MSDMDIPQQRLQTQRIEGDKFDSPVDAVRWFGAVQSQDFANAKWALGLRVRGITDKDVEQAYNDGAILRTHVLRPTWHFVSPDDIRWMLALTGPRVNAANASYYRKLELDESTIQRCKDIIAAALQNGKHLTRAELGNALKANGIATDDLLRLTLIVMRAELDGLICSGVMRGKQFTYALIEERVPAVKSLDRDETLVGLISRYFTSHGPATVQDCVWWSGLTVGDVRRGIDIAGSQLSSEMLDDQQYWFSPTAIGNETNTGSHDAYLLPNFDEFTVAYKNRSAALEVDHQNKSELSSVVLNPIMVINRRIVGTWKRTISKDTVIIQLIPFAPLNDLQSRAIQSAAARYGQFINKRVVIAD